MNTTARFSGGRWAGLALLLLVLCESALWACPNCRDALAGDPVQAGLVRGFFWSILFMLSMPFLILGGLGSYFYWQVRSARQAAEAAAVGKSPFAAAPAGELDPVGADEPERMLEAVGAN
jgi:hypothetical protein